MAAAAETLGEQLHQFSWEFAEAQFAQQPVDEDAVATNYMRPPEQETFGRSSSSARRLGGVALLAEGVDRVTAMITSPEARQVKKEFFTSAEEGFATDEELGEGLEDRSFDIAEVVNDRVMAKDGKTPVSDMTADGLRCAQVRALTDEHFSPQFVRTGWDHVIATTADAMARGETDFNTFMMSSPYPIEGEKASGALYWQEIGYVPPLKRGFVWLFHAGKNGFITGSLSFSGSNKERIRRAFSEIGVDIPEDEVTDNYPGYAFTGNLTEEQAKALATSVADKAGDPAYRKPNKHTGNKITNTVDITKQYEPIMERVFNESYVHICESLVRGYQTEEARELIFQLAGKADDFKQHYAKALYRMRSDGSRFTNEDWQIMHELLVYSTIEMMRALHLKKSHLDYVVAPKNNDDSAHALPVYLQAVESAQFQSLLGGFGAEGARNNRTYSACGLAISLGSDSKNNPQADFGKVVEGDDILKKLNEMLENLGIDMDTDSMGSRWFICPKRHLNYRIVADDPEPYCHRCGADVKCRPPRSTKMKEKEAAPTWEKILGVKLFESENLSAAIGKRAMKAVAV